MFSGDCFARMHAQLDRLLALGHAAAEAAGLHIVLTGTLPTIRKRDLSLDNMVPNPRYLALNDALRGLRGEDFYELHIKGADELRVRQDSVMAEACNASFQVHLQVTPDEFANAYNMAQAITGPTLASATNSPLLFGKRLWAETRIALFEQSVDTRRPGQHMRERSGRVTFGDGWVGSSVVDLYREDITRFRPVLSPDDNVDPMAELEAGRVPPPRGPAAAHGHGVALEPGLLRHLRDAGGRGAAPAHREPRVAVGTEHGRRDRQCGPVARVDAGAPDALPGDQPHDAVRAGARQLRRGRPPRALVDAGVARRRRASGRRAHAGRARADGRRGAAPRRASTTPTSSATSA